MCSTPSSRKGQVVARSADAGGIAGAAVAGIVGSTRSRQVLLYDAQCVVLPTQVLDETCDGGGG